MNSWSEASLLIRSWLFVFVCLSVTWAIPRSVIAQETLDNGPEQSVRSDEEIVADRFLQVLLRRPALGTALDRVYGYHLQSGTLNQLISDLDAAAFAAIAGNGHPTEQSKNASEQPWDAGTSATILGLLHSRRGHREQAIAAFLKAESLRADDAMVSFYLGKEYVASGDTESATAALQRSIDREPPRAQRLVICTELARIYQRARKPDKAFAVWRQLETTFPGDARVSEMIAQTMMDEGHHAAALKRYEELAKRSASNQDSRAIGYQITVAELKRQLGKNDDAIADFERILTRLRPSSWLHNDVRRRIESSFLVDGDFAGLADYYVQQSTEHPNDVELMLRLGRALFDAGRLNEAKDTLYKAVKLSPNDSDVRLTLVDILKRAGDTNDAARQLQTLTIREPDNPDYLIALGNAWLDDTSQSIDKREVAAADAWQRLAKARSDDPVITAQVADLMRRMNWSDQAIALYQHAVSLAPDLPQYREYLGQYYHQLGRKNEARSTWAEIAAGPRESRDNLIRLAEVLQSFGYREAAIDSFSKASSLDLSLSQHLRYAHMLREASRFDDAIEQTDEAAKLATTDDEREQVVKAQIDIYLQNNTLDDQISIGVDVAERSKKAIDFSHLALMQQAAGMTDQSIQSIELAVKAEPESVRYLVMAAEFYREADDFVQAIRSFRKLAMVNQRRKANYLRQISMLEMQLGDVNRALDAADQLAAALPGNPEPLRMYAKHCFAAGRNDEGIEKLRQALGIAPRDWDTRRFLADKLASFYKTDEAIELYWQMFVDSDDIADQMELVKVLSQLHDRSGSFVTLLRRLESRIRSQANARASALLIAEAHMTVQDLGSAKAVLRSLLNDNPRDVDLLGRLVRLAIMQGDTKAAIDYQQQLVTLADTPENRSRHLTLIIENGGEEDLSEVVTRLSIADDPISAIRLIDELMKNSKLGLAAQICQQLLDRNPSLWEVSTRLAGLKYLSDDYLTSAELASNVIDTSIPSDTRSELASATAPETKGVSPSASSSSNTLLNQQSANVRVLRFLKAAPQFGSSTRSLKISNFRDARRIAIAIQLLAANRENVGGDPFKNSLIDHVSKTPVSAVEKLWFAYDTQSMHDAIQQVSAIFSGGNRSSTSTQIYFGPQVVVPNKSLQRLTPAQIQSLQISTMSRQLMRRPSNRASVTQRPTLSPGSFSGSTIRSRTFGATAFGNTATSPELMQIAWEIADADDIHRVALVKSLLVQQAIPLRTSRSVLVSGSPRTIQSAEPLPALAAHQIKTVEKALAQLKGQRDTSQFESIGTAFYRELIRSKLPSRAKALSRAFTEACESPHETAFAVAFAINSRQWDLLPSLIATSKKRIPAWTPTITKKQCSELRRVLSRVIAHASVGTDAKFGALDLTIAVRAIEHSNAQSGRGLTQIRTTTTRVVDTQNRRLTLRSFNIPVTADLLPIADADAIYSSFKPFGSSGKSEQLITHLSQVKAIHDDPLCARRERVLRQVLLAFISHWMVKNDLAVVMMETLCRGDSSDASLALEHARFNLALERNQSTLEILDKIQTSNRTLAKVREELTLEVALKLKDTDRARAAATRLASMNLNAKERSVLAFQLDTLGEKQLAVTLLQRNQQRGGRTIEDELDTASDFVKLKEFQAASEVAASLLQSMMGSSDKNADRYIGAAISILRATKQLESFVEERERRAASSPKSVVAQTELANLYEAIGRSDKAKAVYQELMVDNPSAVKPLWDYAKRITLSGRASEACQIYTKTLRHQPQLLNAGVSDVLTAVRSANAYEDFFRTLGSTDMSKISDQVQIQLAAAAMKLAVKGNSSNQVVNANPFTEEFFKSLRFEVVSYVLQNQVASGNAVRNGSGATLVRNLFASDAIYSAKHPSWTAGTSDHVGGFSGLLSSCLEWLPEGSARRYAVIREIEERIAVEATSEFAQVLRIAFRFRDRTDVEVNQFVDELLDSTSGEIPYQLWWQVGAALHDNGQSVAAIAVLRRARQTAEKSMAGTKANGILSSLAMRLSSLQASIGEVELARSEVLNNYRSTVADYRRILDDDKSTAEERAFRSQVSLESRIDCAMQLAKLGYPLDAIRICTQTSAENKLLSLAAAIDVKRSFDVQLKSVLSDTIDELTKSDFQTLLEETKRSPDDFDLMCITPVGHISAERSSVVALALAELQKTKTGRSRIFHFHQTFVNHLDPSSDNFDLRSLRLLIALSLKHNNVAEQLDQAVKQVENASSNSATSMESSVLKLYSPTLVALQSGEPATLSNARRLADKLVMVANRSGQTAVAFSLLAGQLSDHSVTQMSPEELSSILAKMLDMSAPRSKSSLIPASAAKASSCMDVAELAAKHGSWGIAAEALRRGFAGGPGLSEREIAAALTSSPSRQSKDSASPTFVELIPRMLSLVTALPEIQDSTVAVTVYEVLADIVLPNGRKSTITSYHERIIDDPRTRRSNFSHETPKNVSGILAKVAVAAGKYDDLRERLDQISGQGSSWYLADMISLQLAAAKRDPDALDKAIRELHRTLKPYAGGSSVSSAAALQSLLRVGEPKLVVDAALNAVIPLHGDEPLSPALVALDIDLLKIASVDKETCLAANVWSWMTNQLLASSSVSDADATTAAQACLAGTRQRYSTFSSSHRKENYNKQSLNLLRASIIGKRESTTGMLLRNFAKYRPGFHPASDSYAKMSMDIASLELEYKYQILSGMTFGDLDTDQVISTAGCRYLAIPPPALQAATPFLKRALEIPVGAPEFPVTSSALLLAETAAKTGRVDELVERFRRRIASPGDEIEAMMGLALLAGGRLDKAGECLDRVFQSMASRKSIGSVSEMPIEAALFVARCSQHKPLREQARRAWPAFVSLAQEGKLSQHASFFNRMAAALETGVLSGASVDLPLKHWVDVPLPFYGYPVTKETRSKYKIDGDLVRIGAGASQSLMLFRYPLSGSFTFSHQNLYQLNGETGGFFGGTSYTARPFAESVQVRAVTARNGVTIPQNQTKKYAKNLYVLNVTDEEEIQLKINQAVSVVDELTRTMPFAGIVIQGDTVARVDSIAIRGDPMIPREVDLLGEQLRGWSCPIYDGRIPTAYLPLAPNDYLSNVRATRLAERRNAKTNMTWFMHEDQLETGDRENTDQVGDRHIQYARPLVKGESLSYEFFYDPNTDNRGEVIREVHPTIGRVAVLIKESRLQLRWLHQARSMETFQMKTRHQVDIDEDLQRHQLNPNAWNQVRITNQGEGFLVAVNGKPAGKFVGGLDQRFGFLCEKERMAMIRHVKLSGAWPEKLPANLMEPK